MSENNALQTLDFGGALPATRKTNLAKYASTNRFLRRIQVCGSDSYVKEGKIQPGNVGVPQSAEEIQDLGKSVDLLLLAVRDKCLDLNGEKPVAVFDESHEEYQRIFWEAYDRDKYEEDGGEFDENDMPISDGVKLTPIKGPNGQMTGCMHGPSFLVFERSTATFYELYLANASGREEAKRMEVFLPVSEADAEVLGCDPRGPSPCTLQGKYIKGAKFQWWAPQVLKCSEPFTNLPPMQQIVNQITEFISATIEGGEDEGEDAGDDDRAR